MGHDWIQDVICWKRKVDLALGAIAFVVTREPDEELRMVGFASHLENTVLVWGIIVSTEYGISCEGDQWKAAMSTKRSQGAQPAWYQTSPPDDHPCL